MIPQKLQNKRREFQKYIGLKLMIALTPFLSCTEPSIQRHIPDDNETTQFLLKVCNLTKERSHHQSFYILTLRSNFDHIDLIRDLQTNMIPTSQVNNVESFKSFFTDKRSKNMLFLLEDYHSIINLILGTQNFVLNPQISSKFSNHALREDNVNYDTRLTLPNCCITYGSTPNNTIKDRRRPCDANLTIFEHDLEELSVLSDEVFSRVASLPTNNVWNPQNHLIFFLITTECPHLSVERQVSGSNSRLLFVFKFIWRMFKGQKTLICLKTVCYRYEPFYETIEKYTGVYGEGFFDFSWHSMNGKTMSCSFTEADALSGLDDAGEYCENAGLAFFEVASTITSRLNGLLNFTPAIRSNTGNSQEQVLETGLKHGMDLHAVEIAVKVTQDLDVFDVSAPIELCHMIIRVPRQNFIPQYVAVFYCFSPALWVFVIVTFVVFTMVHIVCVKIEGGGFPILYPERELPDHEYLSTALAIVRYTLGISQPQIVLVEFITGKIVFLIFVFSTLILSTLFQSGMVTMLSMRIRYDDIDTLKEVAESDLAIESTSIDLDMSFLGENTQFDWLRQKMTDGLRFRCENRYCGMESDFALFDSNESDLKTNDIDRYDREVLTILESHAILTRSMSIFSRFNNRIFYDRRTRDLFEFHDVSEKVLSYPLMFFISRRSFYREVFNDVLARFVEGGIFCKRMAIHHTEFKENFAVAEAEGSGDEPRPYSLIDLRIAFICLCVGLLLSICVFVAELFAQLSD